MKTCPICHKVLTDQAKFCFFCGASLLNLEEEPAAPVAEPEQEPIREEEPTPAEPISAEEPLPTEPVSEEPAPIEPVQEEPVPDPIQEETVAFEEPVQEAAPATEPPVAEPAPAPVSQPAPAPKAPAGAKPEQPIVLATDSRSLMTTVGYIFTTILFHIPVIGLIFMIVWGCGKTKNLSRKRFSLACLIMRLIGYIVLLSAAVFLLICFSGKFPILTNAFAEFFA